MITHESLLPIASSLEDGTFVRYPNPRGSDCTPPPGPAEIEANVAGLRAYAAEPWFDVTAPGAMRKVVELVQRHKHCTVEPATVRRVAEDQWAVQWAGPVWDAVWQSNVDCRTVAEIRLDGWVTLTRGQLDGRPLPVDRWRADCGPGLDPAKTPGAARPGDPYRGPQFAGWGLT